MDKNVFNELILKLKGKTNDEILRWFLYEFKGRIVLSSSLGAEDQVLTDMVVKIASQTRIFTLDTGRLFYETYELIEKTCLRYKIKMEVYSPNSEQVEAMVAQKGINLFYHSTENRKECCNIRKIVPLKRAFNGAEIWICGLRKDQSITRSEAQMVEWDDANGMIKLNPLIDWTEKQVWDYIKENSVPYNTLHDRGYPSIGCQPCTREIFPGEDIRAGRWWWENADSKECGLHKREK
ncbi:MAG: phosphoadenylyl-sulfate reductase [Bacteroidales bacterium]|nr:phosphoadenylyl-sulfate reductase [Bacteroidales bacterium]